MGAQISRQTFELCSELFVAASTGIPGIVLLIRNGSSSNRILTGCAIVSILGTLVYLMKRSWTSNMVPISCDKVVFITGCDTGLGFSMAQHVRDLGFTVIAGFLKLDSYGALEIRKLYGDNCLHQIELDLTQKNSVDTAVNVVEEFFMKYPDHELHAIINNAGMMVFGEFEWQTEKLIERQININLIGTMRITKGLLPLLRKYRGRIINISSHCALEVLPGLSVYGATKVAIRGWGDGLRVEMAKYGVKVIQLVPGSFPTQSHIMSRQVEHVYEMHTAMTNEQHKFYGSYFKRYNSFLSQLPSPKVPQKIEDKKFYSALDQALLNKSPKAQYLNEPMRYRLYHLGFKLAPTVRLRDYLVVKFMQMPSYDDNNVIPDAIA